MSTYLLERALIGSEVRSDVLVTVEDGRFVGVDAGVEGVAGDAAAGGAAPPAGAGGPAGGSAGSPHGRQAQPRSAPFPVPDLPAWGAVPRADIKRVAGLTLPGLANCHSHAFHRALRGRTQTGQGTFWTWREHMYAAAERLDPDTYFELAVATYREMRCAGITAVGEFHYLRHQRGGTPYDEPNAMALALIEAAREAGIRIALLDAAYLRAGFGDAEPHPAQSRFFGPDLDRWRAQSRQLNGNGPGVVIGTAIHSVRAVPREHLAEVAEVRPEAPLHVHLSEQVAENEDCLAAHGVTPTQLLADAGVLGPRTSAVHATHLTDKDVRLLGESGTYACFCPTTERDLGDGIGPSRQLYAAGSRLTLGSDSHAVIDPFEEMRAVELDERLATQRRGHWTAADLLAAATTDGHASLGFPDAGRIEVGARADLVVLDTATVRTAGTGAGGETAVFAATAEDVARVMVDGRWHDTRGERPEVGRALAAATDRMWT